MVAVTSQAPDWQFPAPHSAEVLPQLQAQQATATRSALVFFLQDRWRGTGLTLPHLNSRFPIAHRTSGYGTACRTVH